MNKAQLIDNIRQKKSFLCVGLDTDLKKSPSTYSARKILSSLSTKPSSMPPPPIAWPTSPTLLFTNASVCQDGLLLKKP